MTLKEPRMRCKQGEETREEVTNSYQRPAEKRKEGTHSLHQSYQRPAQTRERTNSYRGHRDSMAGQHVEENVNLVLVIDGDLSLAFRAPHRMEVVFTQDGRDGSGRSGGDGGRGGT